MLDIIRQTKRKQDIGLNFMNLYETSVNLKNLSTEAKNVVREKMFYAIDLPEEMAGNQVI